MAVFGLRLRRLPERLHRSRDERRETTWKRLIFYVSTILVFVRSKCTYIVRTLKE